LLLFYSNKNKNPQLNLCFLLLPLLLGHKAQKAKGNAKAKEARDPCLGAAGTRAIFAFYFRRQAV
jgi:hypothetical protein